MDDKNEGENYAQVLGYNDVRENRKFTGHFDCHGDQGNNSAECVHDIGQLALPCQSVCACGIGKVLTERS
jgi:hypothetical protein